MSMLDALGIQEWSPEELTETENIRSLAPRKLVEMVKTELPDEYLVSFTDYSDAVDNICFHTSAINAILAWLNFPNAKLRPFLDFVIGMTANEGSNKFSATDLELGRQAHIGRRAGDDAAKKNFSRKKKEFREWQDFKKIELVKITPGLFDPRKKKNSPTVYQVNITNWAARCVELAADMPEWNRGRYQKNKCIRKAARQIIKEQENSPPLDTVRVKTYTTEQLINRDMRTAINALKRVRDRITREDIDPIVVGKTSVAVIDQIMTNPSGMIGALITPEKDEPDAEINYYRLFKSGEIAEHLDQVSENLDEKFDKLEEVGFDRIEYAFDVTAREDREVSVPKVFDNGEWKPTHNSIELKSNLSVGQMQNVPPCKTAENDPKNDCNSLKTNDRVGGTFFDRNLPDFDGFSEGQNSVSSPSVGKTILTETPSDDLLDSLDWGETPPFTFDEINGIVSGWNKLVAEKIPPLDFRELWSGKYQIYWGDLFARTAIEAEEKLTNAISEIADGDRDISELKSIYSAWIMERVSYYQGGAVIAQSPVEKAHFRKRLESFIKLPGEDSESG